MYRSGLGVAGLLFVTFLATGQTTDDLLFIHHSVGQNWLGAGLRTALIEKAFIDEVNEVTYGTDMPADDGRPDSLAPTPGDYTDMRHWVRWFNDYSGRLATHQCGTGFNRIMMFKSCYPNSNISADGTEPGDPFGTALTVTNCKAVYRHPDGYGHVYSEGGYAYQPLEMIFAAHPDTLFIAVTAPPNYYAPTDGTTNANAHRARMFNTWLKDEWLPSYRSRTALANVAVFDLFDALAYPDDHPLHPNRLRQEFGGETGDSHPNTTANTYCTELFATGPANALDGMWAGFTAAEEGEGEEPPEDTDGDGLSDEVEIAWGLDPIRADSDGDGVLDGEEAAYDGDPAVYNPYDPEMNPGGTDLNALRADTDGDLVDDRTEMDLGYDPINPASAPEVPLSCAGLIAALLVVGPLRSRSNRDLIFASQKYKKTEQKDRTRGNSRSRTDASERQRN